ncbi:MAG TPA: hypothetical protein VN649_10040 [Ramlibacter sp.]|nr:hypothetical protein [Ramlibacter sp.]
MKSFHQKGLMVASSLAMLLAVGACDKLDNRAAGTSADQTGQKSSRAAKEETQDAKARANAKNDSTKAMGAAGEQKKY